MLMFRGVGVTVGLAAAGGEVTGGMSVGSTGVGGVTELVHEGRQAGIHGAIH